MICSTTISLIGLVLVGGLVLTLAKFNVPGSLRLFGNWITLTWGSDKSTEEDLDGEKTDSIG